MAFWRRCYSDKEYVISDKLQMLALGKSGKYTLTEQTNRNIFTAGRNWISAKLNDPVITAMTGAVLQVIACKVPMLDGIATCLVSCRSLQISSGSSWILYGRACRQNRVWKNYWIGWIIGTAKLDINSGAGGRRSFSFTLFTWRH